jgi:hypothetical protein
MHRAITFISWVFRRAGGDAARSNLYAHGRFARFF